MAPYIFRYHSPHSDTDNQNYEYRKRNKHDAYNDTIRKWKYEESSLYGETVYDYDHESDYATKSYSPTPTRPTKESPRRRNHTADYHRQHHQDYHNDHHHHPHRSDHDNMHPRSGSPWSEPPMKYGSEKSHWYEVGPRTSHDGPGSGPRIALLGKRISRQSLCSCHACPEKSSKKIPSMHYDQLRCPYCAAFAQPRPEEVLAYPWTAQSYRPNRRTLIENSEPVDAFSIANISATQKSTHSEDPSTTRTTEAQSTVVSTKTYSTVHTNKSSIVDRDSIRSENKENVSSDTPSEPLFRRGRNVTRSEVKPGAFNSKNVHRRGHPKRQSAISEVAEASLDDDVQPMDSISNVSLPLLRVPSTHLVNNYRSSPNFRANTKVDTAFTRDKYFQSMGGIEPRQFVPHPRPAKDTASEISRMLKGEYYDRRIGKAYTYNVHYGPGKIDSVRVPRE